MFSLYLFFSVCGVLWTAKYEQKEQKNIQPSRFLLANKRYVDKKSSKDPMRFHVSAHRHPPISLIQFSIHVFLYVFFQLSFERQATHEIRDTTYDNQHSVGIQLWRSKDTKIQVNFCDSSPILPVTSHPNWCQPPSAPTQVPIHPTHRAIKIHIVFSLIFQLCRRFFFSFFQTFAIENEHNFIQSTLTANCLFSGILIYF